jgi:hypothetical protein
MNLPGRSIDCQVWDRTCLQCKIPPARTNVESSEPLRDSPLQPRENGVRTGCSGQCLLPNLSRPSCGCLFLRPIVVVFLFVSKRHGPIGTTYFSSSALPWSHQLEAEGSDAPSNFLMGRAIVWGGRAEQGQECATERKQRLRYSAVSRKRPNRQCSDRTLCCLTGSHPGVGRPSVERIALLSRIPNLR